MSIRFISTSAAVIVALSASSLFAAEENAKTHYSGAVFVQTNNTNANEILRFARKANGSLISVGSTRTGGRGSGGTIDPLGSQNSLLLTQDGGFLLAVNSASGTISSFEVEGSNLELVDVCASGGSAPNAIAQWGNLVYVLNVAGNSSVVGFRLEDGRLHQVPKSTAYLSTAISGGSSVNFTPDGKYLLAAERVTGNIDIFPVNADGTLGTPVIKKDPGLFDLTIAPSGAVISLEPGSGTGVITSSIVSGGLLSVLETQSNPDSGTCWDVVTPDGKWVYTANTSSDTISGFGLTGPGFLSLINPTEIVAKLTPGSKALDLAVSSDSKYLYSINANVGGVGIWNINSDGTLTAQTFVPLPASDAAAGFNGIAAY